MTMTSTGTTGMTWSGGWCPTCSTAFLGSHKCTPESLVRRAHELLDMARRTFDEEFASGKPVDIQRGCPCRQENGGSGVCGCVLGGPQVTC